MTRDMQFVRGWKCTTGGRTTLDSPHVAARFVRNTTLVPVQHYVSASPEKCPVSIFEHAHVVRCTG